MADEWLQRYPGDATVMAYIGRSGWNDLAFGGAIPDDELVDAVDESYRLVVAGLPKKTAPRAGGDMRIVRHRAVAAAVAALLLTGLAGCSGSDDPPDAGPGTSTPSDRGRSSSTRP